MVMQKVRVQSKRGVMPPPRYFGAQYYLNAPPPFRCRARRVGVVSASMSFTFFEESLASKSKHKLRGHGPPKPGS